MTMLMMNRLRSTWNTNWFLSASASAAAKQRHRARRSRHVTSRRSRCSRRRSVHRQYVWVYCMRRSSLRTVTLDIQDCSSLHYLLHCPNCNAQQH